jgi:membrane protein CcdC involved in cytochrome C biogenesis
VHNELIKFMKKSKKYIFLIIFHLCIKFQVQTHYNLGITKREISDRFMSLDLSEILPFFTALSLLEI